jgi:hypothetical protein
MDTASDRGSVAINSRASVSVPVQAGSMVQRHGSPADPTVVAGCSPAVHIDLASVSLWPARAIRPDRAAVPCPAVSPNFTPDPFALPPRTVSFVSTLET